MNKLLQLFAICFGIFFLNDVINPTIARACDQSSISIVSMTTNPNGSVVYTLNFTVDYASLDDLYGFQGVVFNFLSSQATPTVVAGGYTTPISPGQGSLSENLVGLIGANVNSFSDSDWTQFDNKTNVLSYEYSGFGNATSGDFTRQISVTVMGCVEQITFYANPESGSAQCIYNVSTGNNCSCTVPTPTVAGTNPTSCVATNGSITLSGLTASTIYSVGYTDEGTPVAAANFTSNGSGIITIPNLNAGSYTNITATLSGCTSTPAAVTLTAPGVPAYTISKTNATDCPGTNGIVTLSGLTPNTAYTVNSSPAFPSSTYTSNGSGVITITGLATGSYTNISASLAGCSGPVLSGTINDACVTCGDQTSPCSSAGTFNFNIDGTPTANTTGPFDLYSGQTLNIITNGNYTLPPPAGAQGNGIAFAIFSCNPSSFDLTNPATYSTSNACYLDVDPDSDQNYSSSETNCSGVSTSDPTWPSTVWVVPVTYDRYQTGFGGGVTYDYNNDNCVNFGCPFQINYFDVTQTIACGGTFTDANGANNYCANASDTWLICPANAGEFVTLNFTSFATEATYDVLVIRNGSASGTILGTFSGGANPGTITSTAANGCLYASFTSDNLTNGAGWSANVTCAPAPSTCGTTFYDSGGASGPYNAGSDLTYTFCPDVAGGVVTVTFTSFDVNDTFDTGCPTNKDYLQVLNGGPGGTPIGGASGTGRYCSQNNITTGTAFTSTAPSGCLTFVFHSNTDGSQSAGWAANVTCTSPCTPPVPTITGTTNICAGGSGTTLTASGGAAGAIYDWSNVAGASNPVANAVNPATTTTYTVTVTNTGGCSATTSATVAVNPAPTANIIGTTGATCPGQTAVINFSGTPNATINFIVAGAPQTLTLNGSGTGSFTTGAVPAVGITVVLGSVTSAAPASCTTSINSPTNITPNPAVTATANNNGPICSGASATTVNLTATGGGTYAWAGSGLTSTSGAATTANIPANTAAGNYTYTVTVTGGGGCSATATTVVVVNSAITPTFAAIPAFCSGTTAPTLPASSTNGINGTWSPATINNTTGGTYTFTPTVGQCATTATLTTTVTTPTTPTFAAIPAFCSGTTAPTLTASSTNGINGTWSPATINNTIGGTYTFTPTAGQCATTATLTTTVTTPTTPTFAAIPAFCSGTTAPTLPASSTNGINGTWSPATINNTTGGTYTFTPTVGQCATTATLTTTVTTPTTPTFAAIPAFCSGTTAPILPASSTNGINGTWSPATINNTTGGTYTFTPTNGQCATTATLTTTVTTPTTPTFATIPAFCSGTTAPTLPASSTNGINGTWSPATINNTIGGTYTFTPTAGQCATTATLTTTVTTPTTPTFATIPAFCSGTTAPTLPASSTNGINGTWSPATINNTTGGTYTFTPTNGQCATTATLTTTVTTPTIPTFAAIPAFCSGTTAPILPASSTNGINGTWSPATINNTTGGTYTFTPTAGQCATTATLTTTVTTPTTPTFAAIPAFCSGTTAPTLPASSTNGINGSWSPATVNNTTSGTYTFTPTAGQCATTATLTTTVTTPTTPTFATIPAFCSGTTAPTLPASSTNGINGTWSPATINNTTGGTYTFTPTNGQCATTATLTTTVTTPTTPTFATIPAFCSGTTAPTLPASSTNGINGSWSPATINNTTGGTYTFTPTNGQCATTATLTTTVTTPTIPTFAAIPAFCSGTTAPILPASSTNGINGTWSPATINNTTGGTYTFTPTAGQCATTATLTTTVTTPTTPTFATIPAFCSGTTAPTLPASSTNGINGSWSPATVNNTTSGTYTFTPTAGQCATTATLTTTVNTLPTLSVVDACGGGINTGSINSTAAAGSGGTLSYTINGTADSDGDQTNLANGSYLVVVTETPSSCSTAQTASVNCNCPTITVSGAAALCQTAAATTYTQAGGTAGGVWSISPTNAGTINAATGSFTPSSSFNGTVSIIYTASGCNGNIDVTINAQTTPTFAAIPAFCSGTTAPTLPASSTNGINGTWSPATVNNTTGGTYTFTPTVGQCATTATLTTTVTTPTTPTFAAIPAFCSGTTAPTLPASSTNGINGSWSPATVNNTTGGTYTFTPTAGQCATTATLTTTVNTLPTLSVVDACGGGINTGSINSTAAAGSGGTLSYTINGTADSDGDQTNLANGSYLVVVTETPSSCSTAQTASVNCNCPTITVSGAAALCQTAAATTYTQAGGTAGGVWSISPTNAGTINAATGSFTPSSSFNGTVSIIYTASGCNGNIDVTINAQTTPTFATIPAFCSGTTAPTLPASSTNGINGTWSPATVNNTTGGTYTFTPTAGQCATTATLTTTVTTPTTPTFATIPAFCSGTTAPTLPASSTNGINGTWSPATISNTIGGTYTFTPTAGQCATTATLTTTVTTPTTPTFAAIPAFCSGTTAPTLPASSTNGINGSWSPATVNNTTGGTYTFTPTAGQCATTATLTTTVNTLPTLSVVDACGGGINTGSINSTAAAGSGGTLSYTINGTADSDGDQTNLANGSYLVVVTETPSSCSTAQTASVNCNCPTITVSGAAALCQTAAATTYTQAGGTAGGVWSISPTNAGTINAATGSFTPSSSFNGTVSIIYTASGCNGNIDVTINAQTTPTFAAIPAFCSGTTAPTLPASSTNGINGTWSPATVNNTTGGTYTFTPTVGQCATTATLTTTVTTPTTPTFAAIPAFCSGTTAPTLPASSTNGINGTWSPATISNTIGGTYTFTPTAGQCATTATLTTTVTTPTTPTFAAIPAFCSGTTAPTLPASSTNGINGSWSPATVNNTTGGTYTFTPTAGQCATTATLTTTVNTLPTLSVVDACGGGINTGSINSTAAAGSGGTLSYTINGTADSDGDQTNLANGSYLVVVTETPSSCSTAQTASVNCNCPTITVSGAAALCQTAAATTYTQAGGTAGGVWSISPTNAGTINAATGSFTPSSSFNGTVSIIYTASGCNGNIDVTINAQTTPTFAAIPAFCSGTTAPTLPASSTNGINGTWSPATVNNTTGGTYTFTPTVGQCATTATLTTTVTTPTTPTFATIPAFCSGTTAPTLPASSTNGINGTWSPATVNSTTGGTYTFTPTAGQCATTATLTTTVTTPPTASISGSNICEGSPLNLTATGGNSYSWSGNGVTNSSANPQTINGLTPSTATYNVTVTGSNGCTATASTNITVNTNPNPNISGSSTFCTGTSTTLTANGGGTYAWTASNGGVISGAANTASITVNTTGTYTVVVTNNGCTGTASIAVSEAAALAPNITGTTQICPNATTSLNAGSGFSSYLWSASAGVAVTQSVNNIGVGTYSVTVSDASGCTGTASTNVIQLNPTATATNTGAVCQGGTVNLSASVGTAYSWSGPAFASTLQNPVINIPNNAPANSYTYTVTVTDNNGCTATATTAVVVNALPTASISGNTNICSDNASSITFTGTPGAIVTYTVNGGSNQTVTLTGGTATVNTGALAATATYTLVSVVSAAPASCTNTASGSAVITVNPLPTASISGSASFCSGGSANVTITGTPNAIVTYTINGGSNQTATLNATGTATVNTGALTTTATYTLVSVTSAAPASCPNTASGSAVISVNPLPTASAGGGGNVCTASTINLSASGGVSYNWSGAGITASTQNQQNPVIAGATVGMSGTYIVTVTDGNGCTATASTTVTVAPCACPNPPTVSGLSNVDICAGSTANLSVTLGGGATIATWTTSGSGTFNTTTGTNVTYTPSAADIASGSVTITITTNDPDGANTQCNAATTTTTVSINALPTAAINGTNTICAGDNTTLTASGGNAYSWTLPNGGGTSSANPLNISNATNTNAGVYTVTVTNANNCTATATTTVAVNALPTATAGGATVCMGDAINLTSSGGTTYLWSGAGITASTQNQQNPSIAASTAGMSGIYTVTVSNGNCSATAITTVTVNANPVAEISGTPSFCEGGSTTLTATGGTVYTWSGAGISNTNQAQQIIGGLVAGSYSYAVTVSNGNCSASATTNLTVNTAPAPQITGSATFCFGGSSTLDAGSGYTTYLWTPGNFATQSITVTSSGTYTVEVTNTAGCTSTDQIVVTAAASLTPNISTNSPICTGENATLDAGNSFTTYAWSQGGNSPTITATPAITTTYTVTVTQAGCSGTATAEVVVNPIPTATITGNAPICAGGSINLTANGDGTYLWNGAFGSNASITDSPTATTTYTVTVTNNGCSSTASTSVAVNPLPVATANVNSSICEGGTINLTASGGTSYVWSGAGITASTQNQQNPVIASATVGMSGSYIVTVTDGNTCSSVASVTATVAVCSCPNPATVTAASTAICAGATANLTATIGGGATTATWTTSGSGTFNPSTGTSTVYTPSVGDIAAGSVIITITTNDPDGNNTQCSAATTTITLTINAQPNAVATPTQPTCTTDTGSILVTPAGDTYAWTSGLTGANPTNLNAGTYTVTVTAAGGCSATASTTINPPISFVATATASQPSCGLNNGGIAITPTGAGFIYAWTGGLTGANPTNLNAGTYTVTVTATASGCTATASATLNNNAGLTPTLTPTQPSCGLDNGEISVSPTGANYSYNWSTAGVTGANPTDLTSGTYTVTVTETVAGCSATASVTLNPSSAITATATATPASCGLNNGSILVTSAGTSYVWSDAALSGANPSNLAAGTYTVTVTATGGCTATASAIVTTSAALTATATATQPTCGLNNGSILVTPAGANYAWSDATLTGANPTNLATGTYTVTVTAAGGCTATASATLNTSSNTTASVTATQPSCGLDNGSILVNSPGTYVWSGGLTGANPINLAAGTYTVTVTAAGGCTASASTTLNPSSTITATATPTATTCGLDNGSIGVTPTGANYAWTGGLTGSDPINVGAGSYTVTVTAAGGCTVITSITVDPSTALTATATATQPSCGLNNGSISVTPIGGTYVWSDATLTGANPTNVASGTYSVTVTLGGCSSNTSIALNTSSAITASVNITQPSCGLDNGSILVNSPGTYAWSDGLTGANPINLAAGTYTLTVTAANGCTASTQITLNTSTTLTASAAPTQPTCSTDTGSILVTSAGATSYTWSDALTGANPTNVVAGTYTVTVSAAGGCTATASTTINNPISIVAAAVGSQPSCGLTNGGIAVTPTGAGFSYAWTGGLTGANPNNLAAGTYTVTVTATATGCTSSASVVLVNDAGLTASLIPTQPSCGLDNGAISVNPAGANYSYNWSTAGVTGSNPTDLTSGTYTVTVTETTAGCSATASVTLNTSNPITASATTTPTTCGLNNGGLSATPTGGTYLWTGGLAGANPANVASGTYTLTVTDTNGCTATTSATVAASNALTATANVTQPTCGLDNGSIAITPAGATYTWTGGLTGANPSNVAAGNYALTVTDAGVCSSTLTVTVNASTAITATATPTQPTCGLNNGSILVTPAGATYVWSDATLTGANPTNLAPGTYTVTVTAAGGCTASASTTLNTSSTITANAIPTATSCGLDNGSIVVTPAGGNYTWTGGLAGATPTNVAAGTYTVTVTAAGGCTVITSINVDASTALTATATTTQPTCGLDNGSILVTPAGATYTWTGGLAGANPTNIAAGTYTVTVTAAGGCTATASATLNTSSAPTAPVVTGLNNPYCVGETVDALSVAPNQGGTITWYANTDLTLVVATGNTFTPPTGVQAGTVSYWVVEDANGCQSPATQVDVVFEVCVTCNVQTPIGVTTTLTTCEGITNTAAFEVTNNDPNATIHWYDATNSEVATGNTFVPTTAGTYTAIAIANNDPTCQSPAVTATLTETTLGDAGFVYDEDTYCQGTNNITPTITGTSGGTFSATGGLVINTTTGTFDATTAGTFTITYDVAGNCPATNTFVVTVIPSVTIAISGNTTINLGENTQLTATGATTYTWTANTTLSCTDCADPVATPTQTTTYTVQTAGGECAEPASVTVLVNMPQHLVIIPNAFSPNNDGTNDIFHIGGVNIATIHLAIYDRWGQKMFEAEGDIDTFWDGTYKGFDCELGVYVYYLNVTYTDETKEMFKNNLTLVR